MEPEFNQEPEAQQNYFAFLWKHLTTGQKWGIGALLLLLLVFPIAVITVLLPTNPFSKAQFAPATGPNGATSVLTFSAPNMLTDSNGSNFINVNTNQEFDVDAMIDTQLNTVSAAKIAIIVSKSSLDVIAVKLSDYLPTVLEDVVVDRLSNPSYTIINFTVGSTAQNPKQGTGKLATLQLKSKTQEGYQAINYFDGTEVAAIGEDGNVLNFWRSLGVYVAAGPTLTPTPTTAPNSASLNIKLKLDSVTTSANAIPVEISLAEQNCQANCVGIDTTVNATNDSTGEYTASLTNISVGTGKTFTGSIKPEGFLSKALVVILGPGLNVITVNANLTPGDINGNGEVDIYDFTTVVEDYDLPNSPADFNRTGKVDIFDFTSVVENYGKKGD